MQIARLGICLAILVSCFVSAAWAALDDGLRALRVADYATAYREFLPLARQCDPVAEFHIGNFYREGRVVTIDGTEARRWYQRAAEQGYAPAQYYLALMHFQGIGGSRNEREGHRWADRAAAQGLSQALNAIGTNYMVGRAGVSQDPVRAYVYFTLATMWTLEMESVAPNAAEYRDRAKGRLSVADLARAEEMIRVWRPTRESVTGACVSTPATPNVTVPPTTAAARTPSSSPPPATPTVESTGSGFVVSRRGHILTNHHVVGDCREVRAGLSSEPRGIASLITSDQANDLALLRLSTLADAGATFRDGRGIRPGDTVVVVGYPLRGLLASSANVTTGTVSALAGILDDSRLLQITAPIQPGNSGGPLLDLSGHVVGVIVMSLDALRVANVTGNIPQNINFALNAAVARAFLDANGVDYDTSPSIKNLSPADVSERAKKYTVVVECWK